MIKIQVRCDNCDKKVVISKWESTRWKKHFCKNNKKCYGEWCSKNRFKENNPNWRDGNSFKKHYCIDCGVEVRKYSKRCKSCANSNKNNPNYIHGKSYEPYNKEFYIKRPIIKKRDDYTCQLCNIIEEEHIVVFGIELCVHHIDYNKKNNKDTNLITLCHNCNTRVNFNRNDWKQYFQTLIKKIYQKVIA